MKKLMLLALILPLSGCWSGSGFYAAAEAVQAIPAGTYRVVDERGPPVDESDSEFGKRVRIAYLANGRAMVEGTESGDENDAILVKLGDAPNLYVAQSDFGAAIPGVGSSVYALVQVTDEGYQIAIPRCDQKRIKGSARAVTSGLFVGKTICRFADRAALELALIDYAKDPISWTEYRREEKRTARR